jgi:hypothetical protein
MDEQVTVRLPRAMAQALARQAKARGVKKSLVVREAVAAYLARAQRVTPEQLWARLQPFVGSVEGDWDAMMQDPIARQIYEHNFRD